MTDFEIDEPDIHDTFICWTETNSKPQKDFELKQNIAQLYRFNWGLVDNI